MRALPRARRARSRRSTGAGSPSCPGSSTATRTRRSRATGRTSSRCGRAGRRTRSCSRRVAGSSRRRARRVLPGPDELEQIVVRHRDAMLAHGTTTFEGKSGYGLDHDTELAQLEAVAAAGGGPDVARRARGAARASGRRRVRRLGDRGGAPGRGADRGRGGRVRRARDVRRRAGPAIPRGLPTRPGSRCGSTATSSTRSARSGWRSSSARARSTTSRRRARTASRRSPRATSSACCSRSPRST